jgi:hypothetical protein
MCLIENDDERSSFDREKLRKARKEHKCHECSKKIEKGQNYKEIVSCYEGSFYLRKHCTTCDMAADWLSKNCGGWVYDHIVDDVLDHVSEYPNDQTLKLIVEEVLLNPI